MKLVRILATMLFLSAIVLPGTAIAQSPQSAPADRPGWRLELRDYLLVNGTNQALVGRGNSDVTVKVTEYSNSDAIRVVLSSQSGTRPVDGLKRAPGDDRVVRWESQYFLIRFLETKDSNQQALVEVWIRD